MRRSIGRGKGRKGRTRVLDQTLAASFHPHGPSQGRPMLSRQSWCTVPAEKVYSIVIELHSLNPRPSAAMRRLSNSRFASHSSRWASRKSCDGGPRPARAYSGKVRQGRSMGTADNELYVCLSQMAPTDGQTGGMTVPREAVRHQIGQQRGPVAGRPASGCPQPSREAPRMAYQIPQHQFSLCNCMREWLVVHASWTGLRTGVVDGDAFSASRGAGVVEVDHG